VSERSKTWHLDLIGPPLCGKSAQAKLISERFGIPSISTGVLFREAIATDSELGQKIREIVRSGRLVPDETVIDVMETHLEDPKLSGGYILDGFPRTINQARFLDEYLSLGQIRLDKLFVLEIPVQEIFRRAVKRRVEERRADDESDESLMNRLAAYQDQTRHAIGFFEGSGIVSHIDGTLTIPQVFESILVALGQVP
jgi:adenylate kinase